MSRKFLIRSAGTLLLIGAGTVLIFVFRASAPSRFAPDYRNGTYYINDQAVTLVNGVSAVPAAPGSAAQIVTRYFGNGVSADLNGDGRPDAAFLITQDTGGSGTFYYIVAALNTPQGYEGSRAFFLGDRIAPQPTTVTADGTIIVNYADRAPGESFAVAPSVGTSIYLRFDPSSLSFEEITPAHS
ncbi:hypothetical protein KGO95_00210 [Patescibacteria group bacterium]|nr:hypothetical protein [Patescibacteria group bacterium]